MSTARYQRRHPSNPSPTTFSHRAIAIFLILSFLNSLAPYQLLYANNNGPNAPEASNFEPVTATDMVNLSSGDMAYVLPLLEIDGVPVTLNYHAGIPMDMEASWVGLGWNINTGAISRGVAANPDDWKDGRRYNLTYLKGYTESYSVNVGVGLAQGAEVGVGLSWGSNKSLSGSVSATIGAASVSIDTNGNYSIGLGTSGFDNIFNAIGPATKGSGSSFGGSLSISGNVNQGGISANIGVGGSSNGLSSSMGVSISGQGVGASYSVGGNNQTSGTGSFGAQGGISMNSFSAGDFTYNSRGFFIPLQIGILSFGFGYNKTRVELEKGFKKYGFGSLYHKDLLHTTSFQLNEASPDQSKFTDYQRRSRYGDVYEQVLPQSEEEFISDYRNQIEKLNFTFSGYDSYDINAPGIGGALRPIIAENSVVVGEGYDGQSIRNKNWKTKVFYHNAGSTLKATRSIAQSNLQFILDGQIASDARVGSGSFKNITGSNLAMGSLIYKGTSFNGKPKTGTYVEVFTNAQIDAGANILKPYMVFQSNQARSTLGYMPDGIGGYKITSPDGKVYHFAQPVYQYEQIQHNFLDFEGMTGKDVSNSSSKRDATPYATHWLLTAITGPDYFDKNNNKYPDEGDLGYWVRLDHGQWTNAFNWRSPFDDKDYRIKGTLNNGTNSSSSTVQARRHYTTYLDNEVEKSDFGYFLQGRKDLYYLDKVVSRNQTAYFVKDIRYDGLGSQAPYYFDPSGSDNDPLETAKSMKDYALYEREYQLKLDKVVIVNNKGTQTAVANNKGGTSLSGVSAVTRTGRYYTSGFLKDGLPDATETHFLHRADKVIDKGDFANFDYSYAQKVIKFNHSYRLATKTPSSNHPSNSQKGRLTLESIKTYGRGLQPGATEAQLYDYMPPYTFNYYYPDATHEENYINVLPVEAKGLFGQIGYDKEYELVRANKDNWGFRKNQIEAWSLKTITTPTGAKIEVKYEEDDFYIEAFARRYWENNLQFGVYRYSTYFDIKVDNQPYLNRKYLVEDFRDYFKAGERAFLDLWICRRDYTDIARRKSGSFNLKGEQDVQVISVSKDHMILRTQLLPNMLWGENGGEDRVLVKDGNTYRNHFFFKANGVVGTYEPMSRGECMSGGTNAERFTLKYKLIANKVPPGTNGGGLKVTEITLKDEANNQYITRYDYRDPGTGESSGITSFNPVYGETFVPYQNELPGPGVMYEWVTMEAVSKVNGVEERSQKMRYHYYTLKPHFYIFNPSINLKDKDNVSLFKADVTQTGMGLEKTLAKTITIEKDLTKIGQLISVESFNDVGQLVSKTTNSYSSRPGGDLEESFLSMKSVFDFSTNSSGDISNHAAGMLQERQIAISRRIESVSALTKIVKVDPSGTNTVTYSEPDPYLGSYTTSETEMPDKSKRKEKKYPAYTVYPDMGPKVSNAAYKNMLTQEAMKVNSVNISGIWRTTEAAVTTWAKDWSYLDNAYPTTNSVWRKKTAYVWKDKVDANGTYGRLLTTADFSWGLGATQTNNQWQQVSEITRYNPFSSPVETRDINGNFAASVMGDQEKKVIAGGNARATELYYCGAEHVNANSKFDGNIGGIKLQSGEQAHTGKYSLKLPASDGVAFDVNGSVGANHADVSKTMRPGWYKVSVWIKDVNKAAPVLKYNGTIIASDGSYKQAGNWLQFNYLVELKPNTNVNLHFTNSNTSPIYLDDFRMHPVQSTMNSYVYDQGTDELTYILDANNLATRFQYDGAGRLCSVFKEVLNDGAFVGGFRQVSKHSYAYGGWTLSSDCNTPSAYLTASLQADKTTMYQGTTTNFTLTAEVGGTQIASWKLEYGDGTSTQGIGIPPTTRSKLYATGTFTAKLTVTAANGLSMVDTENITVNALPSMYVTHSASPGFDTAPSRLTVNASGGSGSFVYSFAYGYAASAGDIDKINNWTSYSSYNQWDAPYAPCIGTTWNAYVIKYRVKDLGTGQVVDRVTYFNRTGCTDPIGPQQ